MRLFGILGRRSEANDRAEEEEPADGRVAERIQRYLSAGQSEATGPSAERQDRTMKAGQKTPERTRQQAQGEAEEVSAPQADAVEALEPAPDGQQEEPGGEATREAGPGGAKVSLGSATFEQLRGLGLSTTQARRVLRYRDERGATSVEDLEEVPGLPRSFLAELKESLTD